MRTMLAWRKTEYQGKKKGRLSVLLGFQAAKPAWPSLPYALR